MWVAVAVPLAVLLLPLGLHQIEASLGPTRRSQATVPSRPPVRDRHLVAVPASDRAA